MGVKETNLSQEEIDKIIFNNMYRHEFLEALMQEIPNGITLNEIVIQKKRR
jgi:hypothetical protein